MMKKQPSIKLCTVLCTDSVLSGMGPAEIFGGDGRGWWEVGVGVRER